MINSILKSNKLTFFILLVFLSWLIQFISSEFLFTEDVWYSTYGEQLTIEQIDGLLEWNLEYWWFAYVLVPIILGIKVILITLALIIGAVLFDISLSFSKTMGVVIIAEYIFLIPSFFQLFWFSTITNVTTITDMVSFTPWTLWYYLDHEELMQWVNYPLNLVNLFELFFIISLTFFTKKFLVEEDQNAYKIVLYGYGSGLLTWAIFISFLSIQYS
ncbi:hypothetical protein EI427_21280 [Flammeovirga pectinis]|uniref:Uncharacterized protein n=1 Tax=Flammeovirga pectinis TaxID=2494373 RepID=A0A3Q9FS36_9BACT|nr:hypothetical protein [Flammeovirga pectinis]AZQ64760.1 hypothetical protein EI427_21280 [Flammeovirga pectinis]